MLLIIKGLLPRSEIAKNCSNSAAALRRVSSFLKHMYKLEVSIP